MHEKCSLLSSEVLLREYFQNYAVLIRAYWLSWLGLKKALALRISVKRCFWEKKVTDSG